MAALPPSEGVLVHAVLVAVSISDEAAAREALDKQVVPVVSQLPGFVAGYWLEPKDGKGWSTVIFDSEESARQAAEGVRSRAPESVTVDHVETRAVVANA
jgi:hypothetical protein